MGKRTSKYKYRCSKCELEFEKDFHGERDHLLFKGFCSRKCANSRVQTEANNLSRRNKLLGDASKFERPCPICERPFKGYKLKTCSRKCASELIAQQVRGLHWKPKDTSKMGGPRPGGGRSKALPYISSKGVLSKLNSEEIKIAQLLDSLECDWVRNWKGFSYLDKEGRERKYYPDFYLKDLDLYLEYKGWVTEKMILKMDRAQQHGYDFCIVASEKYKQYGLTVEELKEYLLVRLEDQRKRGEMVAARVC